MTKVKVIKPAIGKANGLFILRNVSRSKRNRR